jgi:hypothetical protein
LNDWKTICNILLVLGSVFLSWALFNFLVLISLQSPVYPAFMALPMLTPLLIVAALAYVVGFLGHFAGKENKIQEQNTAKPIRRQFSNYINLLWSLHIGAFSTPILLALQLSLGFNDNMIFIFGIPAPIFFSIIAGAVVGLISLTLLYFRNNR